jgi:hypothetical protein
MESCSEACSDNEDDKFVICLKTLFQFNMLFSISCSKSVDNQSVNQPVSESLSYPGRQRRI